MQKHVALVNQIKRPLGKSVLDDIMPEYIEVAVVERFKKARVQIGRNDVASRPNAPAQPFRY